jgi:hypothetical protein
MTLIFKQKIELEKFLEECESTLFAEKSKIEIIYNSKWDVSEIKNINKALFDTIGEIKPNIYAIFATDNKDSEFHLKYIGQTNSKGARTRLTNHLITKNDKTGAQLEKVKSTVKNRGRIKISFIKIEPEALRHYIEEMLIEKYENKLEWNAHGKRKKSLHR